MISLFSCLVFDMFVCAGGFESDCRIGWLLLFFTFCFFFPFQISTLLYSILHFALSLLSAKIS